MNVRNYIKEEVLIFDFYRDLVVDLKQYIDFKFVEELRDVGFIDRIIEVVNDFFCV